jgi:hypothetical protein
MRMNNTSQPLRMALLAIVAFLSGGIVFGFQHGDSRVLEATTFNVVNVDGVPVARLGTANGRPELVMEDADGKSKSRLAIDDDGPVFELTNDSKSRLRLTSTRSGPSLTMTNAEGSTLSLLANETGVALLIKDEDGCTRFECAVNPEDDANIVLHDPKHERRIHLSTKGEVPNIQIVKADGAIVWKVP